MDEQICERHLQQMNTNYKIKPPQAGLSLYKSLFENCGEQESLQKISEGLIAIKKNSARLLNDVKILLGANRFSSARFLLTTADEEMAKLFILLDLCRLDFRRHKSELIRLCKAFYNHVTKHAYIKVHRFDRIHDLAHAHEIWDVEICRWWPNNDIESGEPDMPHDTVFLREFPLYVDYVDYDRKWSFPQDERNSFYFEKQFGQSDFSTSKEHEKKIEFSYNAGLFKPSSLLIFQEVFKKKYINDSWKTSALIKLYEQIEERLYQELKIPKGTIFDSIFCSWPLYHFH